MATPPTTAQIRDNIINAISAEISQTIPLLPKSFTYVLAVSIAALLVLLYKYNSAMTLNMFVATASTAETTLNGKTIIPLVEWGRLVGIGDPIAATFAEVQATVVVNVQSGSIAAGSKAVRVSTGVIYVVQSAVTLNASTVTVRLRAAADQSGGDGSGVIGNLIVGDKLSFANPLANVNRTITVSSVITTAADSEDLDTTYRQRIIRRFQARPQGGAYADFQEWATSVAGIVNAYPYTSPTPGQVDVYVEATAASSGNDDGFPTVDQLTDVANAIELDENGLATRRPVTARVNVFSITRKAFDYTVTGLEADDISAAQDAIETAVDEYLRTREPYIVGLSVLPRADRVTTGAVGGVIEDAVSAIGATVAGISLDDGPAYTLTAGQKAKAGTPTWA